MPAALQYNPEEHLQSGKAAIAHPAHETADEEKFKGPAQSLVITLLACIEQATDKPFAPAILIPKLKRILNDHFDVATSPDRETNAKRGCRFLQNLQPLFITS